MIQEPRAAHLEELPEVIRLVNEVFMSSRGNPPILDRIMPHLFNELNLQNLRVIVEDGKPISHVGAWEGELLILGSRFKMGMVGAVCTHPDHRGKGYASALLEDAFSKMRKDGIDFIYVSGFRNLYKRAGCVEAGKAHTYRIPEGKIHTEERNLTTTMYDERHLSSLIEIYQKEPLRHQRSPEEFSILAGRGLRCPDIPLKIHLAMSPCGPEAYVATGLFPSEKDLRAVEYAGSRTAVLHIIENTFKTTNLGSVALTVPSQDVEMHRLLGDQGLDKPPSEAPANIAIMNPQRFVEKAEVCLKGKPRDGKPPKLMFDMKHDKMELTVDGIKVILEDLKQLALLFFGTPEKLRNPPQPKLKPEIEQLSSNLVQLPTPVYGLNYV